MTKKGKKSSGPKRPSVTKILAVGGFAALVSRIGAEAADRVLVGVQGLMQIVKPGTTVTGATLLGAALTLKALCSFSAWFRKRYVPFLGGFGLRP